MSIDPGRLNRRLVVEAPVDTDDGMGGVAVTFADAEIVWAQVVPASARGDVDADTRGAVVTWRILMRAGPELTTRHRLRDGSRRFDIVAVIRRHDALLEIVAQERVA
ncbi:head-tail adaptor protein [Xanthobacteraceae bacterium Astr-EGSB]|uniref:head-tail adaptor protein n=1 Tax=Astrobacterium formosum TaxID=3069710 RepID=UPI0027B06384|nr:head-tail adaptor protein [Xanthobacteraceae bacterium Astr-EGSB]